MTLDAPLLGLSAIEEQELGLVARLKHSRWLLFAWIGRDYRVRYRQSLLGLGWVLIPPLFLLASYGGVFAGVLGVKSDGGPYVVFAFCGLAVWSYTTAALNLAAPSYLGAQSILSKVYFPREIVPLAAVGVASVDLVIGTVLLLLMQATLGNGLHLSLLLLPLVYVALVAFVVGASLVLATITVFVRDVRQALPLLLQVFFIATPIMYPASRLPESARWVASINPVAVLVDAARDVVIDGSAPDLLALLWPLGLGLALTVGALKYIKAVELRFPDFL